MFLQGALVFLGRKSVRSKIAAIGLTLLWGGLAFAGALLPNGKQQFVDGNGVPVAGGTVTFYIPSTTTFKNTWQDSALSILNTNPVQLDADGRAIIWGTGQYRQIVKDALGNTIWDQITSDGTSGSGGASVTFWAGAAAGTSNAITATASGFTSTDGQQVYFIAANTNSTAATLTLNGGSSLPIVKDTPNGPQALVGGEIVANNVVGVTYVSGTNNYHLITNNTPIGYPGEVRTFAFNACPAGWLETNGADVSSAQYPALATALGTTWGTPAPGNTRLPDFRGYFLRGWDNGRGIDPARAFASAQADDNKQHTHGITDPGHAHQYNNAKGGDLGASFGGFQDLENTGTATTGITINNSGGTEARPKNYAVLFCIKY